MQLITYGLGGYDANKANKNRAQVIDLTASTITRWDATGAIVEQRALTAAELIALQPYLDQRSADSVLADLTGKMRSALDTNATFLALAAPTNAQTLAQVKALTRECSALIRLMARELGGLADLALDNAGT